MKIEGITALVTGANRGLGLALTRALLERGARRVYAAARDAASINLPGVVPLELDVTRADLIEAAAERASDVQLVINKAGLSRGSSLLAPAAGEAFRAELETNVIGPLAVARAFAPVLAKNGGGTLVNILSALSWVTTPRVATYSASKSAAWSITNGLRHELAAQHTNVIGVHVAYMDTDMARHAPGPKARPEDVAAQILDGVEAGVPEVLADDVARSVKQGLAQGVYLGAV
ncbi:MAG: SDR family oxidoreductase [Deltaproteobacteria bacterium]|nr:SDR family oxidoreductase [Deltaproteobacteria bacterium]